MRSDTESLVKMVCVLEKCESLETVVGKSEKRADTDIVESCAESSARVEGLLKKFFIIALDFQACLIIKIATSMVF